MNRNNDLFKIPSSTDSYFNLSSYVQANLNDIWVKSTKMTTHHSCDTDQNQSAAQIGVLIFFWFTVGVVHNLQDQFLLQWIIIERKNTVMNSNDHWAEITEMRKSKCIKLIIPPPHTNQTLSIRTHRKPDVSSRTQEKMLLWRSMSLWVHKASGNNNITTELVLKHRSTMVVLLFATLGILVAALH